MGLRSSLLPGHQTKLGDEAPLYIIQRDAEQPATEHQRPLPSPQTLLYRYAMDDLEMKAYSLFIRRPNRRHGDFNDTHTLGIG
ncbi:hypothetical protein NHX12_025697 [Muraenolepis orangiensis]|uniref:Uncharacterized protein n=1 Tax=Muraenolepis orangiensis TaxID=630683 RepID=A0A9Q0IR66_9TELE|nr:hypothetical protein NHX12_025697 [Muraenolepis orangiensis]